jgi:hypothetical protein
VPIFCPQLLGGWMAVSWQVLAAIVPDDTGRRTHTQPLVEMWLASCFPCASRVAAQIVAGILWPGYAYVQEPLHVG